jgi:hypothetical protein
MRGIAASPYLSRRCQATGEAATVALFVAVGSRRALIHAQSNTSRSGARLSTTNSNA